MQLMLMRLPEWIMTVETLVTKVHGLECCCVPTSIFKWGAFFAASGNSVALCTHWFKARAEAVTYARAQQTWKRYAIARFF